MTGTPSPSWRPTDVPPSWRPTVAEIDLDAIVRNVAALASRAHPAALCAVVKADGYGHGSVPVARAATAGGATWLAVALVEEGAVLRDAGIADRILLLSEPPPGSADAVIAYDLTPTVYSSSAVHDLALAAKSAGRRGVPVHVKIDTGMHRVGTPPTGAVALCREIAAAGNLRLEGVWTHFAVADEVDDPFTAEQLARFDATLRDLVSAGIKPGLVHAANSAGTVAHPDSHRHLVRVGISVYGLAPDASLDPSRFGVTLQPAMRLTSRVSHVKVLPGGTRGVSYGLMRPIDADTVVATVPIGYADGVPRRRSSVGGEVLIGGRRRPFAGRVTMDQLLIDCGHPSAGDVERGDEVVLIGRQGDEEITAWEWASQLDTIAYEIVCGISSRVPRRYRGGP